MLANVLLNLKGEQDKPDVTILAVLAMNARAFFLINTEALSYCKAYPCSITVSNPPWKQPSN